MKQKRKKISTAVWIWHNGNGPDLLQGELTNSIAASYRCPRPAEGIFNVSGVVPLLIQSSTTTLHVV